MGCWDAEEATPGLVAFVLGKTVGFGRVAGGFTWVAILTDFTGLKVHGMSPAVLALRWKAGSVSLRIWVCRGLEGSEVGATTGDVFKGSRVSRTTSGVCFTLLCLSSSRSSFRAEFIVASISCKHERETKCITEPRHINTEIKVSLWERRICFQPVNTNTQINWQVKNL